MLAGCDNSQYKTPYKHPVYEMRTQRVDTTLLRLRTGASTCAEARIIRLGESC